MVRLVPWLRRAAVVAAASALCIDVSCRMDPERDDDDKPIPGPSRRLDEACRSGGCVTEGAAAVVSGLTSDSVAVRIGPGPGSAQIGLASAEPVPLGYDWHVELLVSGTGSFKVSSSTCANPSDVKGPGAPLQAMDPATPPAAEQLITPPADYGWVPMPCEGVSASQPVSVTVSGDDGSVIDIVDLRIVADPASRGGYGCSMAPRHSRRRYF